MYFVRPCGHHCSVQWVVRLDLGSHRGGIGGGDVTAGHQRACRIAPSGSASLHLPPPPFVSLPGASSLPQAGVPTHLLGVSTSSSMANFTHFVTVGSFAQVS